MVSAARKTYQTAPKTNDRTSSANTTIVMAPQTRSRPTMNAPMEKATRADRDHPATQAEQ